MTATPGMDPKVGRRAFLAALGLLLGVALGVGWCVLVLYGLRASPRGFIDIATALITLLFIVIGWIWMSQMRLIEQLYAPSEPSRSVARRLGRRVGMALLVCAIGASGNRCAVFIAGTLVAAFVTGFLQEPCKSFWSVCISRRSRSK